MKELKLSEDVVPIAKFKGEAKQWLKKIADTGQTVVLTQNGVPAGVLISPEEFDRFRERQRFLEGLATGIQDAEAGRVVTTKALKTRLEKNRKSR